jgi:hypothetical protein
LSNEKREHIRRDPSVALVWQSGPARWG